jgi:four helix bundle protein
MATVTFYVLRSSFYVRRSSFYVPRTTRLERLLQPFEGMGAKRFQELEAWQLANRVRSEIIAMTVSGPAAIDFKFRDQIRGSAAAATRNIAEGFGRFRPRDFARGCEIANGELQETASSLDDGLSRSYFTDADVERVLALVQRALMVNTRLILYLRTCKEPKPRYRPRADR